MKVTYNWLKEFVDIKLSAQALGDKLTMAGLEVNSLSDYGHDTVFEIEITSNRPDWLSVIGIAREIAAITGKKLKIDTRYPILDTRKSRNRESRVENLGIRIENKKDCPLYTAKIIEGVKVVPSPKWMSDRLELIGCRSVNNVVDITNYILFTYGEPLHAFDLDKLTAGTLNIIVRKAVKDEKITTIDGQERSLDETNLLIAADSNQLNVNPSAGRPAAIAGIMGGKDSEVTDRTKNILLEAAVFNAVTIRRSRQKLGIQTDSSYRFERSVDAQSAVLASEAAVSFITKEAGGKCVFSKHAGLTKAKNIIVDLKLNRVEKVLGAQIKNEQVTKILKGLGLTVKGKNDLKVGIPSYRQDVKSEIDLIEEIARIYGYENIPKTLPKLILQVSRAGTRDFIWNIKNILAGLGLNEVITYSLIDRELLKLIDLKYSNPVEIMNPLSKEQEILRPTLIPSLIKRVAYNLNQKEEPVNIFEISKSFFNSKSGRPKEELVLTIALCGTSSRLLEQGVIKEVLGILHLKGIIETLLRRMGIERYNFHAADIPNETGISVDNSNIGRMLILEPRALERFDIKNKSASVAEINLTGLFPYMGTKNKFKGLPLYPAISRDISLVVNENIKVNEILSAIKEQSALLREIKVADYYKGKQIPSDCKGITISCLYRSEERTLTESEITPLHSSICGLLIKKFGTIIR